MPLPISQLNHSALRGKDFELIETKRMREATLPARQASMIVSGIAAIGMLRPGAELLRQCAYHSLHRARPERKEPLVLVHVDSVAFFELAFQ
jgi:hypothetical protein